MPRVEQADRVFLAVVHKRLRFMIFARWIPGAKPVEKESELERKSRLSRKFSVFLGLGYSSAALATGFACQYFSTAQALRRLAAEYLRDYQPTAQPLPVRFDRRNERNLRW